MAREAHDKQRAPRGPSALPLRVRSSEGLGHGRRSADALGLAMRNALAYDWDARLWPRAAVGAKRLNELIQVRRMAASRRVRHCRRASAKSLDLHQWGRNRRAFSLTSMQRLEHAAALRSKLAAVLRRNSPRIRCALTFEVSGGERLAAGGMMNDTRRRPAVRRPLDRRVRARPAE